VAALFGLVEVDEVGIDLLGPLVRGLEDLTGEDGEADGELYFGGLFPGRNLGSDAPSLLPVQPGRRGCAVRQPVQGDVVEDPVPGETTGWLLVEEGAVPWRGGSGDELMSGPPRFRDPAGLAAHTLDRQSTWIA
jgi:hypothetical protein